ncbi:MAG: pitrilysin family protein [Bacillota bacterium]|nr:pitrilysin family protein [Bacillota bacterium]
MSQEWYQRTQLSNGIRIVSEYIPSVRSVSLGFWFAAGSRYEEPQESGISHLLEHLFFKGTERRTAREIAEAFDSLGGQLNAYTSKEYTCYYARVLDQHFEQAVEILSDMLLHARLAEQDLEKEKNVVLEEIKTYEDTPDELIHDLFAQAVLNGHPLARSILGGAETVRGLTREKLLRYLERYYTPDRLVVSAAGHVEHERVVAEVAKYFAAMEGRGESVAPTGEEITSQPRLLRHKETEQVHICLGSRGLPRTDPDKYALFLLDTILGGGASSRFFQELREERALVYATYSYHTCFQETGLFTVYAGTSPEHTEEVLAVMQAELERVWRHGVTEAELKRAKEQLKGSLVLGLEGTANRMSRLAKAVLFYDQILSPDELIQLIERVDLEDVQRVASRVLAPEHLVTAVLGPLEGGQA